MSYSWRRVHLVSQINNATASGEQNMKYRHYKGGIYEVVCEAKLEADPNVILMIFR